MLLNSRMTGQYKNYATFNVMYILVYEEAVIHEINT